MTNKLLKILFSVLCISILNVASIDAQKLKISVETIVHNEEPRASVKVVMEPEPKEVKKAWDDFLKDRYDINMKGIGFLSNKDMLSAEAVEFSEISNKELNLYTQVIRNGNFTEMSVFAALGHDIYLDQSNYPLEFNRLENLVEDFIGVYLPDHYTELVNETKEELEDLMDEEEDLTEDIADNEKEIAKLEKENRDKSKELIDLKGQISAMKNILEARKEKLSKVDRRLN